jgi:hypothetical protein
MVPAGQFAFVRHCRHVFVAALQYGVLPPQFAFVVHWTHVFEPVSQTRFGLDVQWPFHVQSTQEVVLVGDTPDSLQ